MHDSTNPGHSIPKSTIVGSYFALVVLTALMVGLSRLPVERFGVDWMNLHAIRTSLIMGAALIMGIIVSMFLMGLRYESKLLNLTIFLSNFVFLLIFVLFTWVDTSFRGEVDPTFNDKINWTSPIKPESAETHAAPAAAAPAVQAAPASSQPARPADSIVPKAEDTEAKKHASDTAPANPGQAKPQNPAQATQPAKTAAPQKSPPSPNPAQSGPPGNTASPKPSAPAGQ